MVPPQPRLTSPPLGVVGGRGAPEALPSLLPPSSPHPGEGRYNLWLQLYTSEKKKKVCRMSHTEKKKNPKPSEKNLRVGLADGIIKAPPEPRLALPLRQPPGEEPRPAGPAPSPMDFRAGRSPASEAPAPAPRPGAARSGSVLPPGAPAGAGLGSRALPSPAGLRPGEAQPGALERGPAGTRHSWSPRGWGPAVARGAAGRPSDPRTWGGGHLEPRRGGAPQIPTDRAPRESRRVRGGSGAAGGRRGTRRVGVGRGGRRWEGGRRRRARGRAGGRRGEADTSGRAALPPRPGGRGGREGGRGRGERRRRAERSLAGPGRAAPRRGRDSRLPRCAPRGRSPPCCPRPASRRQVGAGWRGGLPPRAPPRPGSD